MKCGRVIGFRSGDLIDRDMTRPPFETEMPPRGKPAGTGEDIGDMDVFVPGVEGLVEFWVDIYKYDMKL